MAQIDLPQVVPIDLHEAAVVTVDALQQSRQRRLAGPASADDAQHGPGRHLEGDAIERRNLRTAVCEADVVECDGAGEPRPESAGSGVALQWAIQDGCGLADGGADFLIVLDQARQARKRLRYAHAQ